MPRPQTLVLITGVFLITIGVALIVAQIWLQVVSPETVFPPRSLDVEGAGASASLKTTYVGLVLVMVGAILELVGFLAGKPWRRE